tara:strand:+ start:565 stop:801 length:237 start_codon:yes stop_codon:yes gene_type:complete
MNFRHISLFDGDPGATTLQPHEPVKSNPSVVRGPGLFERFPFTPKLLVVRGYNTRVIYDAQILFDLISKIGDGDLIVE